MSAHRNGFTLIETLLALSILTILFMAVAVILQTIASNVGLSRVRAVAAGLAQEKLETALNLPYDSLGTVGGIPPGSLPAQEVVSKNGAEFSVTTSVIFIDDSFDTVAPTDPVPTDYKRVRVVVTWAGAFPAREPLIMLADVAPRGLETTAGGGTLSLLVFNALGEGVVNAGVSIEADTDLGQPGLEVDLDTLTDSQGRVLLPGAPACIACYKVIATKAGYSTDRTYGIEEVANPTSPHLTVLEGEVSSASFAIDLTSSVTMAATRSRETGYLPFSGVNFTLRGTKTVGRTTLDDPVYKYEQSFTSGVGGLVTISGLEWDTYTVTFPSGSSVDIAGSNPFIPFALLPGTSRNVTFVTTANAPSSLLVSVTDSANQSLPSAVITINNGAVIATKSAGLAGKGDQGQAFFGPLSPATYELLVSLAGYQTATSSVTVSGDKNELIILPAVGT